MNNLNIQELKKKFEEKKYSIIESRLKKNFSAISNNDELINLLGTVLLKQNKYFDALKYFTLALNQNSKNLDVLINIGITYRSQKKYQLSIEYLLKALKIKKSEIILALTANVYRDFGDLINAKNYFEESIDLNPNFIGSKMGIANVYSDLGEYDEAKKILQELINQNHDGALINYAYLLMEEGLFEDAISIFEKVVFNKKNYLALFNIGLIHLCQNNYNLGWKFYENRFYLNTYHQSKKISESILKPRWDPSKPKSRIFIWGEQGIGDQILFSNYLDVLEKQFKEIILCTTKKIIPFLKKLYPNINIFDLKNLPHETEYDYHIPMSSLGLYFHEKFEKKFNFIKQDLSAFEDFKFKKKRKKIRCGISWFSESGHRKHKKSINLNLLKDIFIFPDIEFVNLQYTDETKSINELEKQLNKKIFLDHGIDCFNDILGLAKLIKSCDVVITISNSNAHIAGKLKVKTFLLIPQYAGTFWYWQEDSLNNSYYPSIKYFKQKKLHQWTEPIEAIIENLNKLIENS